MKDKDYIKELFSEKLKNQEAPVRSELWASISTQIPAAGVGGLSWLAKIGIAATSSVAILAVTYLVLKPNDTQERVTEKTKLTKEVPVLSKTTPSLSKSKDELVFEETQKTETDKVQINTYEEKVEPIKVYNTENLKLTKTNTESEPVVMLPARVLDLPTQNEPVKAERVDYKEREVETNPEKIEQALDEEQQYELGTLPNVFTPNGDNQNDYLSISNKGLKSFTLTILDAKGTKVFFTEDPNFKWDGTNLRGEPLPEGSYVYYLIAETPAGKPLTTYSNLTLKR